MKTLHIDVSNKIATYQQRDGDIVCGNGDYDVVFTFDSSWDDVTDKVARFVWNGEYFDVPINSDNTAHAPVIHNATVCDVGVYSESMCTTTPATIICRKSIRCKTDKPNPGHGQHYTEEAKKAALEASASATAAKSSETNAATSATAAKASETAAADSKQAAATSAEEAKVSESNAKAYMETAQDVAGYMTDFDSRINKHEKQITALEAAVYGDLAQEVENSEVAYIKDVPASALPAAKVSLLGGMTRKCANLIPDNIEGGALGINGGKLVSYTSGEICHIKGIPLKAGTYTASGVDKIYFYVYDKNDVVDLTKTAAQGTLSPYTFTVDTDCYCGITGSREALVKHMLNIGTTALPYEPYFEGLRSAPVEEVESVGVNLFDVGTSLIEHRCNNDGNVVKITGYAVSDYIEVKENTSYYLTNVCGVAYGSAVLFDANKVVVAYKTVASNANTVSGVLYVNDNVKYIRVNVFARETDINTVMVTEGSTALPYRPYTKHTLPIPAEVRAKEGYGDGINKDVNNHIRYEDDGKRTWNRRVGKVDMGTLDWSVSSTSANRFQAEIYNIKSATADAADIVCAKYDSATGWANNTIFHYAKRVYINDTAYTDAATFKAAMSGVMLYYELATPITEDISDILPADNYIEVEGGGTLTFKNEYEYDVPSEVTFVTKEASA